MATRSPRFTPSFFITLANFCTSTYRSQYVIVRRSPGSPSQISAALLRVGVSMWRSMQLYETFSFPPTNHFACGGFHSHTVDHGLNQCSCLACSAQKPSVSRVAVVEGPEVPVALKRQLLADGRNRTLRP